MIFLFSKPLVNLRFKGDTDSMGNIKYVPEKLLGYELKIDEEF
jgi:hypothetical protein